MCVVHCVQLLHLVVCKLKRYSDEGRCLLVVRSLCRRSLRHHFRQKILEYSSQASVEFPGVEDLHVMERLDQPSEVCNVHLSPLPTINLAYLSLGLVSIRCRVELQHHLDMKPWRSISILFFNFEFSFIILGRNEFYIDNLLRSNTQCIWNNLMFCKYIFHLRCRITIRKYRHCEY